MTALPRMAALYRDRSGTCRSGRGCWPPSVRWPPCMPPPSCFLLPDRWRGQPLALGLVLTAYLAGVKHSYDWDHLAAIDNSTRKFAAEAGPRQRRFCLQPGPQLGGGPGRCAVVAGVTLVGNFMQGLGRQPGAGADRQRGFRAVPAGHGCLQRVCLRPGRAGVPERPHRRRSRPRGPRAEGLVARLLARPLARVQRPRNIYLIGFLFGLGFDTATTIGLLVMATAASLAGVSPLALVALPLAFTAAMTLCDTLNGVAMMRMYRSALDDPRRKLAFNAVITGISALSALFIAVITLGGILHRRSASGPLTSGWRPLTWATPGCCSWRCCSRPGTGLAAREAILTRRLRTLTTRPPG